MSDTSLPNDKIEEIVNAVESDLLHKNKIEFSIVNHWHKQFPTQPGVYAVFEKSKLIYIGETADIQSRMKDLRRTYNHTLRNKIGKMRLGGIKIGNKFSDEIEIELDVYMMNNLSVTCHSLSFGRSEVESRLIKKHENQLLNSVSLRGK
ncbi:MAG: GIY-YIG nuclease family protein [Fluviicola sp.]|nr:GIY-YIG nuclease family protein [Fluviicola sp.]